MEFGRVFDSLDGVNFALPADTERTVQTLNETKGAGELQVYVGAPKWGAKEWLGSVYPPKTPQGDFLNVYANSFNTVEFGLSFYTLHDIGYIKGWADKVAGTPEFKFLPKFPQSITHIRRLMNAEDETRKFYASLKGFGEHVGPLLMQLGDNFSPKSLPALKAYLETLSKEYKVAVEIRNKDWFAIPQNRNAVFDLFKQNSIGSVITDAAGRRDCVHMELTTPDAVIRFVGNSPDKSDYKRLDEWVERLRSWRDKGMQSVWFYMHQIDERTVPKMCDYLIEQLNLKLGTTVKRPILLDNELGF